MSLVGRLAGTIGILLVLVGVAAALALFAVDGEFYRRSVEAQLTRLAGRAVSVGEDMRIELLPRPGVVLRDVTIAGVSPDSSRALLRFGVVDLRLHPGSLLRGRARFDVTMRSSELSVELDAAGLNWAPGATQNGTVVDRWPRWLELSRILVEEGRVYLRRGPGARVERATIDRLAVDHLGRGLRANVAFSVSFSELAVTGKGMLARAGEDLAVNLSLRGSLSEPAAELAPGVTAPAPGSWQAGVWGSLGGAWRGLPDVDLEVLLRADDMVSLARMGGFFDAPLPATASGEASFAVRGSGGAYRIDALDLRVRTRGTQVSLAGSVQQLGGTPVFDGELRFVLDDVGRLPLAPAWLPEEAVRTVTGSGRLRASGAAYEIASMQLQWQGVADAEVAGSLAWPAEGPRGDLVVSARVRDPSRMMRLPSGLGIVLPELGPLSLAGRLRGQNGRFRLEDLQIGADRPGMRVNVEGAVRELGAAPELELRLRAQLMDPSLIATVLPRLALPARGMRRLDVTAYLRGTPQQPRIEDMQARLQGDGFALDASGDVDALGQAPASGLELSARVDGLAVLGEIVGWPASDLPATGRVRARARLVADQDDYALSDLFAAWQTEDGFVSVRGDVRRLGRNPHTDLRLSASLDSASELEPMLGAMGLRLPAAGALELSALVRGTVDAYRLDALEASYLDDGLRIDVTGAMSASDDVSVDLNASLRVDGLEALSPLPGSAVDAAGSLRAAARVVKSGARYELSNLEVALGDSDLVGHLEVDVGGRRPHFDLELSGRRMDSAGLVAAARPWVTGAAVDGDTPLSTIPVYRWLRAVDGTARVNIGQLSAGGETLRDVSVNLRQGGRRLDVDALRGSIAGGTVSVDGQLDDSGDVPRIRLNVLVDAVELGALIERGAGAVSGGPARGAISLTASGRSLARLLADIQGDVVVSMGKLDVHEAPSASRWAEVASVLARGFAQETGDASVAAARSTIYRCVVAAFRAADGKLTSDAGIALETNDAVIGGGGTIDFGAGTLHVALDAIARETAEGAPRPAPLRLALTGPIAQPELRLDRDAGDGRAPAAGTYTCDSTLKRASTPSTAQRTAPL